MAKKSQQFRLEERLSIELSQVSKEMDITASELVRNAINLYISLYKRSNGGKIRLVMTTEEGTHSIEIMIPRLTV